MMLDTIGMKFHREDLGDDWNIEKIKSNLQPVISYRKNETKPIGYLRNFRVDLNYNELKIQGSLPKYLNGNNIQDFDWNSVELAIGLLSDEIGLPLHKARLYRVDVGANIELDNEPKECFPELIFKEYSQRITRHITSLRFESNKYRTNLLFYDKLEQYQDDIKLIKDVDLRHLTQAENLLRVELQIQEGLSQILKTKNLRVSNLYEPDFCKLLIKKCLESYQQVYKKAILKYPKDFKGTPDCEKFFKRLIVQTVGWEELNYILKQALNQKSLSSSAKSKMLKKFRLAMLDNSSFEFQEHFIELDHKIKVQYVEGLKQIYLLNKNRTEKALK
jgi:hypothetical protein